MVKRNNDLPEFRLFLFDGEGEDGDNDGGNSGGGNSGGDGGNDAGGEKGDQGKGGQSQGDGKSKPVVTTQHSDGAQVRQDNQRRSGETAADYEIRIRDLEEANKAKNRENAERRQENNQLKATVDTLTRRTIVSDARLAMKTAGAVSDRVTELFLADHSEDVKIDPKTGNTTGLEKIAEWKKANADLFKPDADDKGSDNKDGKDGKDGDNKDKGDDKGGDGKRGNSTAAGTSRGAGAGANQDDTGGMPDLSTLKTPQERKAAIEKYKLSLKGAGSSYGRVSSKR